MKEAGHILLLDASGVAHQAYFAAPPRYRDGDGEPTGAIEVYLGICWRMLGRAAADPATHAVAVFDAPGGNFRHDIFPLYKSNRPPARKLELRSQLQIMRAASDLLGLTPVEVRGFEADDVMATLATKARNMGFRVTIVSRDKDLTQLVEDGAIEGVDPVARKRMLAADVEKKFGVPPALVADVQALSGDSVDGIPGMPGCGLDTAGKLIRRFGSLEDVLANIGSVRFHKIRVALERTWEIEARPEKPPRLTAAARGSNTAKTGADWCRTFLQLTTLRRNVRMTPDWESYRARPVMKDDILTFLTKLGARARAESIFGFDPQMVRAVEGKKDPLEWWRETLKYGPDRKKLPDDPQPGFYQRRTMKGGDFVPARIWLVPEYDQVADTPTGRDLVQCELGGKPRDPSAEWPSLSMRPISEDDYHKAMKKYGGDKPAPEPIRTNPKTITSHANPKRKRS